MTNKLSTTYLILFIALLFFGCGGSPKDKTANTPKTSISLHGDDDRYVAIDTKESFIAWRGSNTFGEHAGYVYISKGEMMIEDRQLVGGAVEVDMKTIEDENHDRDNGLINHLKDPDFFDVQKFPFAAIAITNVVSISVDEKAITGDLTIKNITNQVNFPVKIEVKEGMMKATGKLVIDRTKWDVRYGSGKFFDNLKDKAISDEIEFEVKIVARL